MLCSVLQAFAAMHGGYDSVTYFFRETSESSKEAKLCHVALDRLWNLGFPLFKCSGEVGASGFSAGGNFPPAIFSLESSTLSPD